MPRPSPEDRRRIAANRERNAKIKAAMDVSDAQMKKRVESIIEDALKASKTAAAARIELPDLIELMQMLDRAYMLAMATSQPNAANNIVMSLAKLRGFVIDQSAVAIGSPGEFSLHGSVEEGRQRILEQLAEKRGLAGAKRLLEKIDRVLHEEGDDDDVIDGEVNDSQPH